MKKDLGGSKVVKAFYCGLRTINVMDFEYIVKLDGDLILPPNYFDKIINEFKNNPQLGILGGVIFNKLSNNEIKKEKTSSFHVRGALKMIRKKCWDEIGGLKRYWNWDGLDIMEAQFNGWETKSVDVPVVHLRPTSSAYNPLIHSFNLDTNPLKWVLIYL